MLFAYCFSAPPLHLLSSRTACLYFFLSNHISWLGKGIFLVYMFAVLLKTRGYTLSKMSISHKVHSCYINLYAAWLESRNVTVYLDLNAQLGTWLFSLFRNSHNCWYILKGEQFFGFLCHRFYLTGQSTLFRLLQFMKTRFFRNVLVYSRCSYDSTFEMHPRSSFELARC